MLSLKKFKKWQTLLIIFLIFLCINGLLFIRKIISYMDGIKDGSIIVVDNSNDYSSYGGALKTQESVVSRTELESSTSPWTGSDKPIMTIVEFADFNCPYCLSAYRDLKLFLEENKKEVKLIYRYFPISTDLNPELASSCAFEQNKFWEMHNLLFENQRILNESVFYRFAKEINIDIDKFTDCYTSRKYEKDIVASTNLGLRAGVDGTPTFFINGEKISGVIKKESWERILESLKNNNLNKK